MRYWRLEVKLRSERFEDRAYAHTLLGCEAVPVIVSVIANVCVQGFPTVVVRHLGPLSVFNCGGLLA